MSLKTFTDRKRFLSSFKLTLSVILNQYKRANQTLKVVILNNTKKHEPFSFCYYIKCFDNEVYKPELVSYTGEDAAQKFVEMLEGHIREITRIPYKKMIFGKEEKNDLTSKLNAGYVRRNSVTVIRLETIAILPANIEELHTTYVILSIKNLILRG